MNHPSSKAVFEVVERFKSVLHFIENDSQFDMGESTVCGIAHKCGTVHCVAGWYWIAKNGTDYKEKRISFFDGIREMSNDLGFTWHRNLYMAGADENPIDAWAANNLEVWGVEGYVSLFSSEKSYRHPTKRPEGAQNLQHIIDHWQEVGERLRAMENPYSTDATSELIKNINVGDGVDQPVKPLFETLGEILKP